MPHLLLKNLPRYECLHEASQQYPDLDPSAFEAYLHLLRAGDETSSLLNEHLSQNDVSHGRFTVLMLLLQRCPCDEENKFVTPAELADMAGCTRATMTGLVDTLERDSLVKREPAANDRRMMAVKLTSKGSALMNRIMPGYFKRLAALMVGLSEAERKTLVRLLGKIAAQVAIVRGEGEQPEKSAKSIKAG